MQSETVILNACYTVISPCSWQDAVRLILSGKAEAVAVDESRPIRSKNLSMPFPKIIRLLKYVKIKFKEAVICSKNAVIERDKKTCIYCGRHGKGTTLEHILPTSRGGKTTFQNTAAACVECNSRKGSRTPEEAGMPLLWQPGLPTRYDDLQKAVWDLL